MKAYCLFEQSGTFKRAFQKLGIQAADYDILNDFGETDCQVDLFSEICKAYDGGGSIFDKIATDDIVLAFFPCTRFEVQIIMDFKGVRNGLQGWDDVKKLENNLKKHKELSEYYELITMMAIVALRKGIKMVIENPYSTQHYLTRYWSLEPKVIDNDRRKNGDFFAKPTQYWFINCDPKEHLLMDKEYIIQNKAKQITNTSNKVDRSMIALEYAERFIRQYIL